ncbi:hypothetical protein GGS20DRAFT_484061 [Poronia punctata]|nr:hypothetical protein GGS20DRAFT_484061 [Poronia punctata]
MPSDQPRPELSAIEYNRKFGRYDFKRFDHLVRHHASVGSASLGKVDVDCRFLFEKSKWGTLDGQDSAGIIYLDLAFNQPSDCRLKNATVQVTLDDDDEHLLRQFPPLASRVPVQIDKYGPREMTGEPQYERVAVHDSLIPTFNVGSFGGIEGMGRERFKERLRECRWKFESHLTAGNRKRGRNNWAYKVLRWQVTENELQDQSQQSNTVHTAFSFVHSGQPFFMRVEVTGKLESRTSDFGHQIKSKVRRLKFPPNPQNARAATTLINFQGQHKFTTPLDGLNQRLELAMEQANMTNPVEIESGRRPRMIGEVQEVQEDVPIPAESLPAPPSRPYIEENQDPSAPTTDTIASLSDWLMAPPIIRPPVSMSGGRQDTAAPTGPSAPTRPPPQPRVEEAEESEMEIEMEVGHEPSETHAQSTDEEEGSQAIITMPDPSGLQTKASAEQVALSTVMLLVRIWMVQTFATFFGYGRDNPSQLTAGDVD